MADMKFNCPHCKQEIACDELWGGHQIQCPTCQGEMMVPQPQPAAPAAPAAAGNPLVPKPPGGGSRLSAGVTQVARSSSGTGSPQKPFQGGPVKKKNPALKFAIIGVSVVVLAVGGYFGWQYVGKLQDNYNAKSKEEAKKSDGGEVGHIAEVNQVLDATDPSHPERMGRMGKRARDAGKPAESQGGDATAPAPDGATPAPQKEAPIVAPTYTLDANQAKIPDCKANGTIGGASFVAEGARIDGKGPAGYVLTLRQGSGLAPDRAVQVYLRLKPTEGPTNQSFTVASDAKDLVASPVTKIWRSNPQSTPQLRNFSMGYALKLELGDVTNGNVTGKIYLAFPDTEQSVVAGSFKAMIVAYDPSAAAQVLRGGAPAQPPPDQNPSASRMQRRYGNRRP